LVFVCAARVIRTLSKSSPTFAFMLITSVLLPLSLAAEPPGASDLATTTSKGSATIDLIGAEPVKGATKEVNVLRQQLHELRQQLKERSFMKDQGNARVNSAILRNLRRTLIGGNAKKCTEVERLLHSTRQAKKKCCQQAKHSWDKMKTGMNRKKARKNRFKQTMGRSANRRKTAKVKDQKSTCKPGHDCKAMGWVANGSWQNGQVSECIPNGYYGNAPNAIKHTVKHPCCSTAAI